MKQLEGFELGYVVALFDGEGWFGLRKNRWANRIYAQCCVKITDEDIIYKLRYYLDVNSIVKDTSPRKRGRKDTFELNLYGKTAIELADQLYQYLSERRQKQIDRMKMYNAMYLDDFEKNKSVTIER